MTAIEKLQMLIEAAEYLDRRERGKVTYIILNIHARIMIFWHAN